LILGGLHDPLKMPLLHCGGKARSRERKKKTTAQNKLLYLFILYVVQLLLLFWFSPPNEYSISTNVL
jgi:hypothetical protein